MVDKESRSDANITGESKLDTEEKEEENLQGNKKHKNVNKVIFAGYDIDAWYPSTGYDIKRIKKSNINNNLSRDKLSKDNLSDGDIKNNFDVNLNTFKRQKLNSRVSNNSLKIQNDDDIGNMNLDILKPYCFKKLDENSDSDNQNLNIQEENLLLNSNKNEKKRHTRRRSQYKNDKTKDEYSIIDTLYVCNFCFKYTTNGYYMGQHLHSCIYKYKPLPGKICWRNDRYLIKEIDGAGFTNNNDIADPSIKLFSQCMCIFAKLFLESKYLFFATEPFLFYVLIDTQPKLPLINKKKISSDLFSPNYTWKYPKNEFGQIVGFFSKEKLSWYDYNLACIVVFPPFQGNKLGQLLISFSYAVSLLQSNLGAPEKPLSIYGSRTFKSYWSSIISKIIAQDYSLENKFSKDIKIDLNQLSWKTGIVQDDVLIALNHMNAIKDGMILYNKIIDWTEKHDVYKTPFISPYDITMS